MGGMNWVTALYDFGYRWGYRFGLWITGQKDHRRRRLREQAGFTPSEIAHLEKRDAGSE